MSEPTPKQLDIQQWLATLSVRCVARKSENLELLVRDYAAGLDDLPYEAFTTASREAASRQFDSFPTYRQLRKFLEKWAEKNQAPPRLMLPAGVIIDPLLEGEDRFLVEQWWRMRPSRTTDSSMARALDLLRRHDQAFRSVCASDVEAHALATRRNWLPAEDPVDVSEVGIARSLIKLEGLAGQGSIGLAEASLGLKMLRKQVADRAPERLNLLPDAVLPQRNPREPSDRRQDAAAEASARAQIDQLQPETEPPERHQTKPIPEDKLEKIRREAGISNPPSKKTAPANDEPGVTFDIDEVTGEVLWTPFWMAQAAE